MLKKKIIFAAFLLLAGCAEKTALSPIATSGGVFVNKNLDEISRRISKLNVVIIAPASGIIGNQSQVMKILKKNYGVDVPHSVFMNKGINYCADSVENSFCPASSFCG